ncbi:MAG TPA: DUF6152 family protein [Gammaproteobacteria bacterium]|nr:DUF6152 family protein [Gammaproteobacteria bacterium]
MKRIGALGVRQIVAATFLMPLAASAHHSFFGRFDTAALTEIEGEVTELSWRNPHAYLAIHAVDAAGAAADWEIETSSLTVLKRMGIDEGTIKIGDRIRIAGNPALGEKKEMYARHVLMPDGRELLLNVGLKPRWTNRTVGDESLLMARAGDPSRPDLGLFRVWSHTRAVPRLFRETTDAGFDIESYPMTDSARAALAAFNRATDNPTANCLPKGMPTIMEAPYPIELVQQDDGDILLRLEEYDLLRPIRMNSNVAAEPPAPSPLGFSVGRWDERTLVVTTTRINWPFFSQLGIPQSEAVEIVERFTPTPDGSRLDYEMTVTDPMTFTEPVVLTQYWLWLPSVKLLPYECAVR